MKRSIKAENTRQHILDTSFELVLRKGFVGVGLQEILKACDVPKGSFYHYFASKEAFGCALLEQYIADYKVRIAQLLQDPYESAYARLMALWNAWIDDPVYGSWAENCLIVKLAAEVSDLSEDMRKILNAGVEKLTLLIMRLIQDAQKEGSISADLDAEYLAKTMYQLWLGAALLSKLAQSKDSMHLALKTTQNMLQ